MRSKFWIVGWFEEATYVLDEGYNVWDFDEESLILLDMFIHVIGVFDVDKDSIEPSVIDDCRHGGFMYIEGFRRNNLCLFDEALDVREREGYILGDSLQIYNTNLLMSRGLKCLRSECGALLRLDMDTNTTLDLEEFFTSVVGFIYGDSFRVFVTEWVDILNLRFCKKAEGRVYIVLNFRVGHELAQEELYNQLIRTYFSDPNVIVRRAIDL